MLAFKVVDFSGPYHVILGQPCYIKFMAIPSYAYLKLKISGPTDIITVEAKAQRVLGCEQSNIELAAIAVAAVELKELYLGAPPLFNWPGHALHIRHLQVHRGCKVMQVDTKDLTKTVQLGTDLSPK
jgi:hypothetical protein